ncbi:hypothetical protein [Paenibacillus sp. y28]
MMKQDEEMHQEEPLAPGRGIMLGLVVGTLMWAGIIGGVVYLMK